MKFDQHAWNLATAGAILSGFLLTALIVQLIWKRLLAPLVRYIGLEPGQSMLTPLRGLVFWGIVLSGFYYALTSFHGLETRPQLAGLVEKVYDLAWELLIISTLLQVFNRSVAWYVARARQHTDNGRDISYQAVLVRRIVNVVVIFAGLLYLLHTVGVDITPLLASSAISGVALAFAAQDTIANLFAGFYLTLDKPIRVGDVVKLESGQEGIVEEIGWRNTRVRLLTNVTVLIPNSKLSQSVFTNYDLPQSDMSLVIPCRVAYESDLRHVEQVTLAVAQEVLQRVDGADPEWTPTVLWREFGENGLNFNVVLRIQRFQAQYNLQSEFVKALHQKFQQEQIRIPYPTRVLASSSAESVWEVHGRDVR